MVDQTFGPEKYWGVAIIRSMLHHYTCSFYFFKQSIFYFRIRSDHNWDNTAAVLHAWAVNVKPLYHGIDIVTKNIAQRYSDASGPNHWSADRLKHIIKLREAALVEAGRRWADFIFVS